MSSQIPPAPAPANQTPAVSSPPPPPTPSPPPTNSTAPSPTNSTAPPPSTPTSTPTAPPPPPAVASPPPPSTPPPSTPTPPPPSSGTSPPSPPSPSPPPPRVTPPTPPSNVDTPPPPPPPSSVSPSSSSGSSSTGIVVGAAVGAVAILVLLGIFCFCRRKKRRHPPPPPSYQHYGAPPPSFPVKGDYNGAAPQNWQHHAPPPQDHVIKILPPQVQHVSPLPPPGFNSSGGSGSNYSGSENPAAALSPRDGGYGFSKSTLSYEELAIATNGFSDANLLGQGGFGFVHKGLFPNGKEIAVKQLKSGSGQGEREFQAEIEIISRVHHRHLVSLVGYCISQEKRLLVYEFVPNNTLEFHLHGKGRPTMDWQTRLKIALGSAKGLAYLHEDCHPKIIHRDIKAANILLDFKFEAKVADFGLAKFASDNNTHVSTRVMGTFGYLAPEYASTGKLTDRSDVFSFGVMLLEIITGRCPVDSSQTFMDESLVDWARPLLIRALEDGNYDALVDPCLGRNYDTDEIARTIACAAAAVRHSAKRRPKMSQIVRALEGDMSLEDLNEGVRPGHTRPFSYGSSEYDSSQYSEDIKRFRKVALESQGFSSSQYSAPSTRDYGRKPSVSSMEEEIAIKKASSS